MSKSKQEMIEVLNMVVKDVQDDAENFDGKLLTGKNVAEYFGYHGAAIAALANILRELIEEDKEI